MQFSTWVSKPVQWEVSGNKCIRNYSIGDWINAMLQNTWYNFKLFRCSWWVYTPRSNNSGEKHSAYFYQSRMGLKCLPQILQRLSHGHRLWSLLPHCALPGLCQPRDGLPGPLELHRWAFSQHSSGNKKWGDQGPEAGDGRWELRLCLLPAIFKRIQDSHCGCQRQGSYQPGWILYQAG